MGDQKVDIDVLGSPHADEAVDQQTEPEKNKKQPIQVNRLALLRTSDKNDTQIGRKAHECKGKDRQQVVIENQGLSVTDVEQIHSTFTQKK